MPNIRIKFVIQNLHPMTFRITPYKPELKNHFIALNKAWLEDYFFVEPHDIEVFENLEDLILTPGGAIFFCLDGTDKVVGTVAMQKVNATTFELAKLAVDLNFQGQKLSYLLMDACIAFAKKEKATTIMLMSSTKLTVALNLYRKYRFIETPLEATDYARADIQMELRL